MCSLEIYFGLIQFGFVFWGFKLLSFIFFIVKCYPIAYKDSLQEYNIILLYSMIGILWSLTHYYIFFYFDASSSHFIFYLSLKKGNYSLSLSLSLSLYIYIYIKFILFCNFTLGWWIIIYFFIILFWVNMIW